MTGTAQEWLWLVDQFYAGPVKPFCPCDAGRPQDCKPEQWGEAHTPKPDCARCGHPVYAHFHPDLNCPRVPPANRSGGAA